MRMVWKMFHIDLGGCWGGGFSACIYMPDDGVLFDSFGIFLYLFIVVLVRYVHYSTEILHVLFCSCSSRTLLLVHIRFLRYLGRLEGRRHDAPAQWFQFAVPPAASRTISIGLGCSWLRARGIRIAEEIYQCGRE